VALRADLKQLPEHGRHAERIDRATRISLRPVGKPDSEGRRDRRERIRDLHAVPLELDQVLIVQSDQRLPHDGNGAAREGGGDRFQGDRTAPIAERSEDGLEDVRLTGLSASGPPGLQRGVDQLLRRLDLKFHGLTPRDCRHVMWHDGKACSNYRLKGILGVREDGMGTAPTRLAIGALSKRTGSKVETIRYYERVGLLPLPGRSAGGYRLYETGHLKRLTFVRQARALGFSIDEVRRLLDLADHRQRSCAEARVLTTAHLADVRAKIADLQTMERVLEETVAKCANGRSARCPLIDAFYRDGLAPARESGAAPARRRVSNPRRSHTTRIRRGRRSLTG
jgi:MerR family mercuric resistance operon transcriptional regulator